MRRATRPRPRNTGSAPLCAAIFLSSRSPSLCCTALDATLALDHQYPRFADRIRHMLRTHRRIKHVASFKNRRMFDAGFAIAHLDAAIENGENFLAIVDVPLVGLIGPVQTGRDAAHAGDVERAPGTRGREGLAADDFHDCAGERRVAGYAHRVTRIACFWRTHRTKNEVNSL